MIDERRDWRDVVEGTLEEEDALDGILGDPLDGILDEGMLEADEAANDGIFDDVMIQAVIDKSVFTYIIFGQTSFVITK